MSPNTVYVGRPSKWGNPAKIGIHGTREEVLEIYREWLETKLRLNPHFLDELKGKDLACWCSLDKSCHADVLLKLLEAKP